MVAIINSPETKTLVDVLPAQESMLLTFDLGDRHRPNSTTYNPSVPFEDNGKIVMLVRHESDNSETDSEVLVVDANTRQVINDAPIFAHMQDPYYLGEFTDSLGESWKVIGGVKIAVNDLEEITGWQDVCYRYKNSITGLTQTDATPQPFLTGVYKWKDTRYIQLSDGIAVFPRPQGRFGGPGRIGYFKTDNLDTLQQDLQNYADAEDPQTLIDGVFDDYQWGGANQLIMQNDGTIQVIGHGAQFNDQDKKDYEAIAFSFDTTQKIAHNVRTIASADDFDYVVPKFDVLGKVIFTGGTIPCNDGSDDYWLFAGVGDKAVGVLRIKNPLTVQY